MYLQLGEIREIGIEVVSDIKQDFVIDTAEYSIIDSVNNEIDRGYPTIDNHKILTLFPANNLGKYYVIFKYHIGAEIFKAKVYVEVE